MIQVNNIYVKLKGKESEICADLGMIFNSIIEEIGIEKTKTLINIALETVIKENEKETRIEQIKTKKELKAKMQRNLPKELADLLCSLI